MKPLNEPPRYKREAAGVWREEAPPEDTAPIRDRVDVASWATPPRLAAAALADQVCPICGEGPWKSPLNHVARKHGIDRHTMRDTCGLTTRAVVADPDLSERFRQNGLGRDMSAATEAGRRSRRKYRMTEAGKRNLTDSLSGVTPDQLRANLKLAHSQAAEAKRAATLRAKWADATPEERAAWGRRVGGDREHMDRMRAARKLQPCGTVAAYKRGCRCEACRGAKRASRRPSA